MSGALPQAARAADASHSSLQAVSTRGGITNAGLIERLRQGPLRVDQFYEVAASANSLKVRIHNLREQGVEIESVPLPNGNRRPKVAYRLVSGACPCCQREFAE